MRPPPAAPAKRKPVTRNPLKLLKWHLWDAPETSYGGHAIIVTAFVASVVLMRRFGGNARRAPVALPFEM